MAKTIDRQFAMGLLATLASEALGRGSALAFQFLVANQLGAAHYGLVALALASAALLFPLADLGIQNLTLRVTAAHDLSQSFPQILTLKLLLAPAFFVPLAAWFHHVDDLGASNSLAFAGVFYFLQSVGDLLRQAYRGQSWAKSEFFARFGMPLGNLASLVAVWHGKPGPAGALLALCCGPAALVAAYLFLLPPGSLRFSPPRKSLELAREHRWLLGQSLLYLAVVGISTRVDAFVLQNNTTRSELGRYFAVLNFVMAGGFLAQGLSAYLYPRLHRQTFRRRRAFFRAALLQGGLGLAMMAGVALVGPFLFTHLFHSASYAGAEHLLPGMGALLLFTTLDWLWLSVLLGKDRIWLTTLGLIPLFAAKVLLGPAWTRQLGATGMLHAALLGALLTTCIGAVAAYSTFTSGGEADS